MLGAIAGGICTYVFYKDHFDLTEDKEAKRAVFCTSPAVRNYGRNMVSEIIGTFVLVLVILWMSEGSNNAEVGLGSIGAIPVAFLIVVLGMSLGGTTGYAINPARDLGPRIAHAVCPIKDKGSNDWSYSWIPVVGPIIGGVTAAIVFAIVRSMLP